MDIIRSFDHSEYSYDGLDRVILREIREIMISLDLWELHMEGTFEEIVEDGSLYVDPDDVESLDNREEVSAFMRSLADTLFVERSIALLEDGEQGMTFLYQYNPDIECNCTDPYCGV